MTLRPQSPADDTRSGHDALQSFLRAVPRRYRLPPLPSLAEAVVSQHEHPATILAYVIEHARRAQLQGVEPDPAARNLFATSLAALIREAMQPETGDAALQAMVARHQNSQVREYASLAAHAQGDRRRVQRLMNSVAHPAKRFRYAEAERQFFEELHDLVSTESWSVVTKLLRQAEKPEHWPKALASLADSAALRRLQRLDALGRLESVQRYRALRARMGPRARSDDAMAEGAASRKRGDAVEAQVARAMQNLARRLNEKETRQSSSDYRVVTALRAPATLPADHHYAKTEWDVVLLRSLAMVPDIWEVALLLEAKASVDAAATDLPRLKRGLHLLSQAERQEVYVLQSREGPVPLSGTALKKLALADAALDTTVLYCTDSPEDVVPRLLSASSRMQLLSAPASLEFAGRLNSPGGGDTKDVKSGTAELEVVWNDLLGNPRWQSVLQQYETLREALSLMVHVEDLEAFLGNRVSHR